MPVCTTLHTFSGKQDSNRLHLTMSNSGQRGIAYKDLSPVIFFQPSGKDTTNQKRPFLAWLRRVVPTKS